MWAWPQRICGSCAKPSRAFQLSQAIIFLEIVLKSSVWTLCVRVASYAKDAIVGACHCTRDGQEHKTIWRAGPERERIFHLRDTACREQGSHCRHERLAWVASRYGGRGLRAPAHSSRKSWERTIYNRANNFHPVADKLAMCTGQELTFEPTSDAHARVDYNTLTW